MSYPDYLDRCDRSPHWAWVVVLLTGLSWGLAGVVCIRWQALRRPRVAIDHRAGQIIVARRR